MKNLFLFVLGAALLSSCSNMSDTTLNGPETPQVPGEEVTTTDPYFITEDAALEIAQSFLSQQGNAASGTRHYTSGNDLKLIYSDAPQTVATRSTHDQLPSYYVFGNDEGKPGFVIVSASKIAYPILGFSTDAPFATDNLPCNLAWMLDGYKAQINGGRQLGIAPSRQIEEIRRHLESKTRASDIIYDPKTPVNVKVKPILGDILWDQTPHYNAYCPGGTPVGCVATATSMIMRHWEYPDRGAGQFSYNSNWGVLSFDYNYPLEWDKMPVSVTEENDVVAKFCYGVAVSVKMNFDHKGSGAMQNDVPDALQRHYFYPANMVNIFCDNYTDEEWLTLLRKEIDNGRAIQYGGTGDGGGHSFVCDGYAEGNYFHFNWGWHGQSNGWFQIDALNPGSLGTGGGSGGFNRNQQAIINFQPPLRDFGDNKLDIPNEDGNGNAKPEDNHKISGGESPLYGFLRYVSFYRFVNSSNYDGYADYSNKIVRIKKNQEMPYMIIPQFAADPMKSFIRAWVDFDNDGTFADNEIIIDKEAQDAISGKIKIDKPAGDYRLRISFKIGDKAPQPEEIYAFGETEDYTLRIQDK